MLMAIQCFLFSLLATQYSVFSFLRLVRCIKSEIRRFPLNMAVLFSSEDEDSVLRMTAQLVMERNLSKADEFVIRLLVKTAEEKMQSAEEKMLSIQMLAEEKMLSIQMLAEEKIKTVKQEVKTLEAEKAKLLSDIQKIYVDDFITSSRGLIEYGEYWMMNKEQYKI